MQEFDAIRPYSDSEVRPTLDRVIQDPEFLQTLIKFKFPNAGKLASVMLKPLAKQAIEKELKGIFSVRDFQSLMEKYLGRVLDKTVTKLTSSGLENLDPKQAYCFISNHRDIAMDSAFVNWTLYHNGFNTVRIAIGDNLLTKPFASDLMRLNKSFIVIRSATSRREKLEVAKTLSRYIHYSIINDRENIWIAQREGRAKDGIDETNPAIISMLTMSKAKDQAFGDFMAETKMVPVSISYEYDPCDLAKARELFALQKDAQYEKAEHEDVESIAKGITGFKGHVHVSYGQPLDATLSDVTEVVNEIDRQVIANYILHPSNCVAFEILEKQKPEVTVTAQQMPFASLNVQKYQDEFRRRLKACHESWRDLFLHIYANPVYQKLKN